jgi:ADP-ribose pyrophosphatase
MDPSSGPRAATPPPDPPPFAPFEVLGSRRIYKSRWCGLRADDVVLPDGSRGVHHVVEITDAVAIVPLLRDGRMVLIGQYRYPHGQTRWEIPAGRLHADETPRSGAERELAEETGCRAGRWMPLPGFYPINGISDHFAHVFAALDCEFAHAPAHEPSERIVVQSFSRSEVRALLRAGRLVDAFTSLSLYMFFDLVEPTLDPRP